MRIIIVIVIAIIGWLAYEMIMAPLMPDNYGLTDKEIKEWNELTKKDKNDSRN